MEKVGLVLEGGGLRGIYTAGVLDAFLELGLEFPYLVGVSAGACNAVSYVSKQQGRAGRVILQNVMDPRYLGWGNLLRRGSIFGMEFIFDEIPRRIDPFDYQTFEESPVEFEAGATSMLTGRTRFFPKDRLVEDRHAVLRASSSMPLVAKPVMIDGEPYLDGAVGDSIPVGRALERGCDRAVVVLTQPRGFVKKPMSAHALRSLRYRAYPEFVRATDNRHVMYNETLRRIEQLEREGRALVIAPSHPCTFSGFEKDLDKLKVMYQEGIDAARAEEGAVRAFLAGGVEAAGRR